MIVVVIKAPFDERVIAFGLVITFLIFGETTLEMTLLLLLLLLSFIPFILFIFLLLDLNGILNGILNPFV